jgi:hypothetical protein
MEIYQPNGVLSPPPLQIVKRKLDRSVEDIGLQTICTSSNDSLRSALWGQEVDQPLTIVKKRGNKRSQLHSSEQDEKTFGNIGPQILNSDTSMYLL